MLFVIICVKTLVSKIRFFKMLNLMKQFLHLVTYAKIQKLLRIKNYRSYHFREFGEVLARKRKLGSSEIRGEQCYMKDEKRTFHNCQEMLLREAKIM